VLGYIGIVYELHVEMTLAALNTVQLYTKTRITIHPDKSFY